MKTMRFDPGTLLRSRCLLIDDTGAEMELRILNTQAEYEFGGNVSLRLECEWDPSEPKMKVKKKDSLTVRKVIYNPPATVILWEDGTKTVVKCDELDEYVPDYGFALCYMKKALGNTSRALNDALHKERIKV